VDPVPDPLLLRKSGSAGDRTRDLCICSQKLWPLDHRGGLKSTKGAEICVLTYFTTCFITCIMHERERERLWHINYVWRRKKCHNVFAEYPNIYLVSIVMFINATHIVFCRMGREIDNECCACRKMDRWPWYISGFPRKSEFLITGTTFEPEVTV